MSNWSDIINLKIEKNYVPYNCLHLFALKVASKSQTERILEANFNFDIEDQNAAVLEDKRIVKIRKLNKKIGDNLKPLYNFRRQIYGQV